MSDKEKAGATPDNENETKDDSETKDESQHSDETKLGDAGKKALDRERDARKAAEKELADLKRSQAEAERQREEAEAKAKGEFEKLANDRQSALAKLQGEYEALVAERDALQAELDGYLGREKAAIAKALKDLPKDLTEFFPGEDAALDAQRKWLETATAQAAKRKAEPAKGNGANPERANGNGKVVDEKSELARTGRYVM